MAHRLDSAGAGFAAAFDALLAARRGVAEDVDREAAAIVRAVRQGGDAALLDYTARFDRVALTPDTIRLSADEAAAQAAAAPEAVRAALSAGGRANRGLPRPPDAGRPRLPRRGGRSTRRPLAPAGCGRALRAGRHRGLSQHRADERDPRAGRGRAAHRHGGADAGRRARCGGHGRRRDRRRHRDLPGRRRAGRRRARLRHRDHRAGGQDRGPRQRLRRRRQAPGLRHRRHRHDRRSLRDTGGGRQCQRAGVDRRGPALPGRARRGRAGDPYYRRRGVRGTG